MCDTCEANIASIAESTGINVDHVRTVCTMWAGMLREEQEHNSLEAARLQALLGIQVEMEPLGLKPYVYCTLDQVSPSLNVLEVRHGGGVKKDPQSIVMFLKMVIDAYTLADAGSVISDKGLICHVVDTPE